MEHRNTDLNTWFDPDDMLRKDRKENAEATRTEYIGRPFFVQ